MRSKMVVSRSLLSVGRLHHGQCAGVAGQYLQVARDFLAVEGDAPHQDLGCGQQLGLGRFHQQIAAGLVGIKPRQTCGQKC